MAEYFSHDHNTRNKKKLAALIHQEGMAGYGLFWVIVEMLHEDTTNWMEKNRFTFIAIAKESGLSVDYITDFIEKCINEYEVFIEVEGKFTTERVLRNMQLREDIKEKRAKAGKISAEKRSKSTHVEQVLNICSTGVEQNPTNKRKGKEIKEKENNNTTPNGVDGNSDELPGDSPAEDLKTEYNAVTKETAAVFRFIAEKKPTFIEPYIFLWNEFAEKYNVPKIAKVNSVRKKKFGVRIRDGSFNFPEILRKAAKSEILLTGGWFGFDWIIKNETNYLKILEGNYDQKPEHAAPISTPSSPSAEEIKARAILSAAT